MNQTLPVSTPIQLASTLRGLRKSRSLTQEEVGQLLGVNQKRIARIEASPGRTSFDQISRLVSALGGRLEIRIVSKKEGDSPGGKRTPATTAGW